MSVIDETEIQLRLKRARLRYQLKRNAVAWVFLLPAFGFFVAFLLIPIASVVRESFMQGGILGPSKWVGLTNWKHAFSDPMAAQAIRNTLYFVATIVPSIFVIALVVAVLLRPRRRGSAALRAAVYFPQLIPLAAAALIWLFMINPDFGILNVINRELGKQPINFIGDAHPAFILIALFEVWRGVAYWTLFLLVAMLAVPRTRYQAAELDGAPPWRRFWHITLPGIRPSLAIAVLLSTISVLQLFDSVYILTTGGPNGATQTIVTYMYQAVYEDGNTGFGAVLGLTAVAAVIALTAIGALVLRGSRGFGAFRRRRRV